MIQFEIDGEMLDVPEGLEIQLQKTNMLFAFDKVECERSVSFDIPATPTNDRVFGVAKWTANVGTGMRRKFNAQMQAGVVVRDGFLHVESYDDGNYKCVFVTGELLGLKMLKEAGKIKEYLQPAGGIIWSAANVKDANTIAGQANVAITRYLTNGVLQHPSVDLGDIMQLAYNTLTGRNLPAYQRGYRLIPKELKGIEKRQIEFTFAGTGVSPTPDANYPATLDANTITSDYPIIISKASQQLIFFDNNQNSFFWKLAQFVPLQEITLSFPADFPDEYFLMSIRGTGASDPSYYPLSDDWFLGDYVFSENSQQQRIDITGTPLAGKSVTIPTGTPFIIMSINWFVLNLGFTSVSMRSHAYNYILSAEGGRIREGDKILAVDLLPNLTLTELLKIYTYLEGKALYYSEENGIEFDPLDMEIWDVLDLTGKVAKSGDVARKFADYAKQNLVVFESGEDVLEMQREKIAYTIDNDNLAEEKELAKIPYSEGQIEASEGFICARLDAEDIEKNTLYADGIMVARGVVGSAPKNGLRVVLPKNSGVQELCDASTCMQVQVRMSMLEFEHLQPRTLLYYNGVGYVWTAAKWSREWATLNLSKTPSAFFSPFDENATAIIRAAFPDKWAEIKIYGIEHPEIVPYVNAHPLCINIWFGYKQNGLVFQVDCDYMCSASLWKDVRQGVEFVGENIVLNNGVAYFNGNDASYLRSNGQDHNSSGHTIEIGYIPDAVGRCQLYSEGANGTICASYYQNGQFFGATGSGRPSWAHTMEEGKMYTLSSAHLTRAMANGIELQTGITGSYWGSQAGCRIGARSNGTQFFKGRILFIRIYDHILTAEEMSQNQAIDLLRWQSLGN